MTLKHQKILKLFIQLFRDYTYFTTAICLTIAYFIIFFSFTSSPVQRSQLIKCYYGHVQSLVRHKEAIELVELAYNDYANASERSLLIQEFYGPQFAVFKDGSGQSLSAILSAHPEEKGKLIEHMKTALTPLLDK